MARARVTGYRTVFELGEEMLAKKLRRLFQQSSESGESGYELVSRMVLRTETKR